MLDQMKKYGSAAEQSQRDGGSYAILPPYASEVS
jgi:hypothetical protein